MGGNSVSGDGCGVDRSGDPMAVEVALAVAVRAVVMVEKVLVAAAARAVTY